MKLNKKETPRLKSKRPPETKHISLERIARGKVVATSQFFFQVELSKKRYFYFREEDASEYIQPRIKTSVRCIYHGHKDNLLPYAVYDLNWNLFWKEK
jgi:hypothetical protein